MNIKCFLLIPTDKVIKREVVPNDGRSPYSVTTPIYKRSDTGEETTIQESPVGAIWENTWYYDCQMNDWCGVDGKSYSVKTPEGDWCIDSRASNCDKKDDHIHKCWCRHGEAPNFTVDKIGNTCNAGGGSFMRGNYHGFLRNGELTNC